MIFAALLPIIICFIGIILSFKLSNEKMLLDEAEATLSGAESILDGTCESIKESLVTISKAPATDRLLTDGETSELISVYRMLYSSVVDSNRKADFALYDSEGKLIISNGKNNFVKSNLSVKWGILYELSHGSENTVIRAGRMYSGDSKKVVLRIGRTILDDAGNIEGYAVAQIADEGLSEILRAFESDRLGEIYILDDFGELIYSSALVENPEYPLALTKLTGAEKSRYYVTLDMMQRYYYSNNNQNNLQIMYCQQVEPYNVMSKSLMIILIIATVAGIILAFFVSNNFSAMFYRPIRNMIDGMAKIKHGDFSVKVDVENDDELGHLSSAFNDMSSKLTDNMNKLVNREKELADANIKMMQAQLNPHFIYNTLDTMKWIGKDNEIPEVATLSSGLADIMRASISSGQTVTLEKEIDLVESYAAIQQIRFNDKFELLTDIPKELLKCEVPKLILQPIVENAIIHGFEDMETGGLVYIRVIGKSSETYFEVENNGKLIDLDDINSRLTNFDSEEIRKGYGIVNVNERIKALYGEEYGINYMIRDNHTVAYFKIPSKEVREVSDESINR